MSDRHTAVAKVKAVRYGIFSEQAILPHENARHLRALRNQVRAACQPIGAMEESLVDLVVMSLWRLRRLNFMEARVVEVVGKQAEFEARGGTVTFRLAGSPDPPKPPELEGEPWSNVRICAYGYIHDTNNRKLLEEISRQMWRTERTLHRALRSLLQLQDRRGASGLPEQIEASLAAALGAHGGPELQQRFCRELELRRRPASEVEEV